jgi:hypothetical protein
MPNNVFASGASRRYGRLAFVIGVLLVGVLCGPTKPPGSKHCPHYPPSPPLDASDPVFQIISPNGGEVFHVGDQCTVKVRSRRPCLSALIFVDIGGKTLIPPPFPVITTELPGDSASKDSTVNAVIFTVSDSFTQLGGSMVYSVSDSCLIYITDYKTETYSDFSDCYFSIKK